MDILLFSHDTLYATAALEGGVRMIVVDWEAGRKAERQLGRDTEINHGTVADLVAMAAVANQRLICRINNSDRGRAAECRLAVEHGATEVWLPMLRRLDEIDECLRAIDGRATLGVQVETREAMLLAGELDRFPLARVFIGLHDYRIDYGHPGLFDPIVDGTIDRFRDQYSGAFGFAGVTDPARGSPIRQRLLLAAMVRMRCSFGIARRSFRADVPATRIADTLRRIEACAGRLAARTPAQVRVDHRELRRAIADVHIVASLPVMETAFPCAP